MLRRVLLVRFLLEDVGFYVDDSVGSAADDARSGVNVEGNAVVHVDEVARHDFGGGPHACNKTGNAVSQAGGGRFSWLITGGAG